MTNYSTLGHNLKRDIFRFCEKISDGLHKPVQKFVTDMVYGLLAGQSCFLTEIARKLKEGIALDKTVERLSRNLMNFDDSDTLTEQYFQAVKKHFDDSTILLIDDSDISKPCSGKLEGLCPIRDGSTGKTAEGYWYAGVSALTAEHKQPIPVYSRVYSSVEDDYISNNHETLKSFSFMSSHFPQTTIRALDRGYDAGYVFKYFIARQEAFIVRMNNRKVQYKGETVLLSQLVSRAVNAIK